MSKAPTLRQFQKRFPTEESCLEHLMRTRFGERHACDKCGKDAKFYRVKERRSYACEHCGFQVYPTAGTPFDRTRTPLRDWFFVMFQFVTSRNGVAAKEVQRQLGVTYKTAWRMCDLIRAHMGALDGNSPIGGAGTDVEIDETFIGGKRRGQGNRSNKAVVVGMVERGGDVVTKVVAGQKRENILPAVTENVIPGGTVHTDYLHSYRVLGEMGYTHLRTNHAAGEYVSRETGSHTQSIEGFWSALKRGINGTYIHVSQKHLPKYLAEFEFRHNLRQSPHLMLDRLLTGFGR